MERVALVTGASSGIGKVTAKKLLSDGYIVYAAARREEKMQDLKSMGIHVLKMDITDEASVSAGFDRMIKEQKRVDILVNNAGYGMHGAIEDVPLEKAKAEFDVNLFGAARLISLCLPYMRENGYGKIINVSSIAGRIYAPMTGWYFSSKYALEGLSNCLRVEVRQFGIDVVVVEPGLIRTEITGNTVGHLESNSSEGAYSVLSKLVSGTMNGYKKYQSKPEVIANVISKAIKAKRPRQRYAKGRLAKVAIFAFRWIPNRIIDFAYLKIQKRLSKKHG